MRSISALRSRGAYRAFATKSFKRNCSTLIRQNQELQNEGQEKPVWSWNEWNHLEEVIVGRIDGMRIPSLEPCIKSKIVPESWPWIEANAGRSMKVEEIGEAGRQVEEFCRILQLEGVAVKRPEVIRWDELGTFKLPFFSEGGSRCTCPRDGLMVIGDEFIESAMAWRSRYFEMFAYKKLLTEYFHRGAKWTCAPKPTIRDEMFVKDFPYEDKVKRQEMATNGQFILTESEIAFDAADAVRCGSDIFVTLGNSTNRSGVEWLRRHVSRQGIRVHSLIYEGIYNTHADTTLVPLKPGLLLVNPSRPFLKINDQSQGWEYFTKKGWKVVHAPEAVVCKDLMFLSKWIHMNLLSLDEERVIVQKGEYPLIKLLASLGMKPIQVDMTDAYNLGGAFHCWTVDVKRVGKLESYF